MYTIDLPEEHVGTLCNVCGDQGGHPPAELYDRDLGPLCHECFSHALRATVLLRWVTATSQAITEN
jgi:hypothetical protein